MIDAIAAHSRQAAIVVSLAILLLSGFLLTRITKKLRLPNVTGYLLAGILIGPSALGLIPDELAAGMDFIIDIALAFISFGVGRYFRFSALKRSGGRFVVITLFESLTAGLLVTLAMILIFKLPVPFSLLIGAIGCTTAPASTIMTIRQYKAKGLFVDTAMQVIALDNAIALISFSACAAVVQGLAHGGALQARVVLMPVLYNLLAIAAGAGLGYVLKRVISESRSQDHRLALVSVMLLGLTGLCALLSVSPLLSCMALGATYVNLGGNKGLFKQVNRFTPPLLMLFFVLSGMRLDLSALRAGGLIGLGYFFIRILGKYAGAYAGAYASGSAAAIRNFLGLALVPQAGVSIGLAALGQRLLPTESGTLLSTIILSSAVLYEIAGPACARLSLFLSGSVARPVEPREEETPAAE